MIYANLIARISVAHKLEVYIKNIAVKAKKTAKSAKADKEEKQEKTEKKERPSLRSKLEEKKIESKELAKESKERTVSKDRNRDQSL